MIVELNGPAGVGKLTIARCLAPALNARLVDNHTLYNPAFASTTFRTPEFYETVRTVREITFGRLADLPADATIILTIAPGHNSEWAKEWQASIRKLADNRRAKLLGVHLTCDVKELASRMASPTRALLRKLIDPNMASDWIARPIWLDHCDSVLKLDVTKLEPTVAAGAIQAWLRLQ